MAKGAAALTWRVSDRGMREAAAGPDVIHKVRFQWSGTLTGESEALACGETCLLCLLNI